ncbi:MAG: glycosyltransferase family 87 protein [Pseudomonadota bacterium]
MRSTPTLPPERQAGGVPGQPPAGLVLTAKILAILSLGALALWIAAIAVVLNMRGYESWPTDFTVFWRAAQLALAGKAASAFDNTVLGEIWQVPGGEALQADWLYPPTALLLALPFGALPFSLALAAFVALGLGLFVATIRPLLSSCPSMVWVVLASPAVPLALHLGNLSLHLTAALTAATGALLAGRSAAAGTAIAIFAIKPQLALVFPIGLIASARWRAVAAAAIATAGFTALATLVFALGYWEAFLAKIADNVEAIEGWERLMITPYAMALYSGAAQMPALLIHTTLALLACAAVAVVWRRREAGDVALALLCLTLPFLAPRVLYYECTFLLIAFIHLWRAGAASSWGGRLCLLFCW